MRSSSRKSMVACSVLAFLADQLGMLNPAQQLPVNNWMTARLVGILQLIEESEKRLAFESWRDSDGRMIRGGFVSEGDRKALVALARDNLSAGRVTRRANALVLLDDGLSCQEVAKVLLFDDDTIRGWYDLFEQGGLEGLTSFDMGGSASKMSAEEAGP